jgi:breast cancer 2 susceptibility protein
MAQRSALKRIQEQDSPASLPMVLCVSGISRQETNGQTNTGQPTSLLELTDGWYRIRANVDPPLQRAIDAGRLGVGYKIAISGARVSGILAWIFTRDSNASRYSSTRPKRAQMSWKP